MSAKTMPMRVKPTLMDLPGWKRLIYPLWLQWYRWRLDAPIWQEGLYDEGAVVYWRGVKLVCGRRHYAGGAAEHPWDPGWGWSKAEAATLWEPARRRDDVLLALVGDPRSRRRSAR